MYPAQLILRLCDQPRTFEFISKNVLGLDPVQTLNILKDLESDRQLSQIDDLWVVYQVPISENLPLYGSESNSYLEKYMGYYKFLKTPHPLDYEWRNSTQSLNKLVNKLVKQTTANDKLLLLGMPTLFATAIEKDIPNKVSLIERNKPILKGLQSQITNPKKFEIIEADIFKMDPQTIAPHFCVMMDPPWYSPHFYQFMWLAANCIPVGGMVAISLPPINTRPNILDERIEWFSFCRDLGLCIETIEPQLLQYAMPFFEFNALRAAGVERILPFWRKGDFTVFRKTADRKIQRPKLETVEDLWVEKEFGSMRIRIKRNPIESSLFDTPIEIKNIIKGDILPGVSSRDPIRQQANIWTSGNRIFNVNDPKKFQEAVESVTKGNCDTEDQKMVSRFLNLINDLETNEFKSYLDWIYYEMERQAD